jgi:hypothetical protein
VRSFEINGTSVLVAKNWHISDVINSRSVFDATIVDKLSLSAVETGQEIKIYTDEQLSNARDIGDGTFSRTSNATMQNGTNVTANTTRYETGRFGQAVMIEEWTTNMIPNTANDEVGDYTLFNNASKEVVTHPITGKQVTAIRLDYVAGNYEMAYGAAALNLSINTDYTLSYDAWIVGAGSATLYQDLSPDTLPQNDKTISSICARYTALYNSSSVDMNSCVLRFWNSGAPAGSIIYITNIQLEQKAYATSWIKGGTTRIDETLTIPTAGIWNRGNWTIEMIYEPMSVTNAGNTIKGLFFCYIDASNFCQFFTGWGGEWIIQIKSGGTEYSFTAGFAASINVKYQVAVTGDSSTMRLFVNGVQFGSVAYVEPVGVLPANIYIGSLGGNYRANGLIDDLRISNIARDGAEILDSYNTGAALPIDAHTTAKMALDGTLEIYARPVIFAGTIEAPEQIETDPGYLYYPITAVDYNQLADKRLYAASHESTLAGNIVSAIISAKLSEEGVTAGSIEDGPVITKANFNYKKCSESLNYLKDVTGMNWNIDFDKQLNFFSNSTNLAPWILNDTVQHEHFRVKKNRSQYRNRQYVRAGTGKTTTQSLEKPSPAPDGSSRSFIVRFPVAERPVVYITESDYDSYTKIMMHMDGFDGSNIFTDEIGKTWTAYSDAQIDTAQKKFGIASVLFDGTNDYIDTPDSSDFYIGSDEFTIDFWVKRDLYIGTTTQGIFGQNDSVMTDANLSIYSFFATNNYLYVELGYDGGMYETRTTGTITDSNWHHIALIRSGNTFTIYVDGIADGTRDLTGKSLHDSPNKFAIGRNGEYDASYFSGWIDEFRFSNGIARWTANFTVPTSAYIRSDYTSAILSANVGINGLDTNKSWYYSYDSNIITQDSGEAILTAGSTLEITYTGLYPIIMLIDDPAQIAARAAVEIGTSGIYENFCTEKSINENSQATEYTEGLLLRYGIIPSAITFDTEVSGLRAGQLLPIQKTLFGINASYLIESVDISAADAGKINYSVRCLDGSALGGWETFFRDLLKAGQEYIIQENEVIILLSTTTEKENWGSSTTITINGVETEILYD